MSNEGSSIEVQTIAREEGITIDPEDPSVGSKLCSLRRGFHLQFGITVDCFTFVGPVPNNCGVLACCHGPPNVRSSSIDHSAWI